MIAADKQAPAQTTVLVASDSQSDAKMVRDLLLPEFGKVFVSTAADLAADDFERHRPDVLVLAFNALTKSEEYYLGLFRVCTNIHLWPHRTVVLCNKDEVNRAYKACRKGYFDDYILFWPMTNDAPRLLMSLHIATRDLAATRSSGPSPAEFAFQVRRLSQLGNLLDQQILERNHKTESPSATDATKSARHGDDEFQRKCGPHLESIRALTAMAELVRPIILIVDDDEFQRKIIGEFLDKENFRLEFAIGGIDALNIVRKMQPDLILMDIAMPELDGIETTRRIKTMPHFANIPIIMTTGKSEGTSVRDSMKAGAIDFVVKPFERDILLAKVTSAIYSVCHGRDAE